MINVQDQKFIQVTPPGAIVDNTSWTCASVDTTGFDYATFVVQFGAMDIAMAALSLGESDVDSGYVAIANFATLPATLPAATDDNTFVGIQVNLLGRKKFLKLVMTGGDGSAGTYASAFCILSRAQISPSTAALRGFGQEIIV